MNGQLCNSEVKQEKRASAEKIVEQSDYAEETQKNSAQRQWKKEKNRENGKSGEKQKVHKEIEGQWFIDEKYIEAKYEKNTNLIETMKVEEISTIYKKEVLFSI